MKSLVVALAVIGLSLFAAAAEAHGPGVFVVRGGGHVRSFNSFSGPQVTVVNSRSGVFGLRRQQTIVVR